MFILFFNELIQFLRLRRCVWFPNTNTICACIGNTRRLQNNVPILNNCNSILINIYCCTFARLKSKQSKLLHVSHLHIPGSIDIILNTLTFTNNHIIIILLL